MSRWLNKHLNHEARQRVHWAVVAAEKRTPAEIVPVLVRRSSPHGHVPVLAALILLALLWGSGHSLGQGLLALSWGDDPSQGRGWLPGIAWGRWGAKALDLLLCGLAGWALSGFARVRRWLTRPRDRVHCVQVAAEAAFHHLGLHKARHDHGVLIFVSLEERRAVILAGPGIASKADQEAWAALCDRLVRSARRGDLAGGYEAAISGCADLLEKHFPQRGKRPGASKLADRLRILHEAF